MYRSNRAPLLTAAAICITTAGLDGAAAQSAGGAAPLPPVIVETTQKPAPKKAKAAKKKSAPTTAATAVPGQIVPPPSGATALGTYNPALDLPGLQLPPGTTITTAGPVYGYQALSATSSTKTATPIEQIPQSIQVIPKSVIEDQRNLTVNEALRNASNVQGVGDLSIGNTDLQPLKMRGFTAEQWLDGLVVNYDAGDRDAFANVERIEVLKGPSAILYGGGPGAPVGGAVNVISKLPTNRAGGELGVTFGSNAYARPYFDINQPIAKDGTVLFRVTGEYTSADSFIDVLEQDRYSINPTLTLTNKTDTTLTIQGRKSRFKQQAYQGLPVVGTIAGDFRIDRNLYIGPSDIPRSYSEVESVTTTLDHKFDSIWSFNVKGRWSHSKFDQNAQSLISADFTGGTPDYPPSTWSLINDEVAQEQEEITVNPNLQARFGLGSTRNTVLVGADYSRVKDKGHMFSDFGVLPVDLLNPSFPSPYTDPNPSSPFVMPFFDLSNVYTTKGVYGQWQSTLYDRIHVLGGVRLANLQVDYLENAPTFYGGSAQRYITDETKLLPRVGAVVDLTRELSVYASYSEGMRWAGFVQPVSFTVNPEESQQREAGVKFNVNNELSGTVSVFHIDRTNVPLIVAAGAAVQTAQRSEGFEADAIWQPNRNWQVLANYGYVNAEFADSLVQPEGNKVPNVPQHSGRLWVNYNFDAALKGWSAGAGIYASSGAYVDAANVYKTGSYYTVDAKVGYENERFAAALNVKNLTGEDYFVPYSWFGGQVAPGADRAYYGTFAVKY